MAGDCFQALHRVIAPAAPMVQQWDSLVVAPEWECGSWPCQLGGSRLRFPSVLVHDVAAEESGFKWEGCRGSLVVFERDAGGLVWVGELCWAELGVLPPGPGDRLGGFGGGGARLFGSGEVMGWAYFRKKRSVPLNDLRWPNTWEEMMPTPHKTSEEANPQIVYRIKHILP